MLRPFAHPVACCCLLLGVVKLLATCKRTQQFPTLLGQQCWELLCPFVHPVASCGVLLGVVAQSLKPVQQTDAITPNTVASVCTGLNDFHPLLNVQLQSLGITRMKLKEKNQLREETLQF